MLYDKIKKLAVEKNITIAELERELGFANGAIGKWNSANPKSESLYKVAQFFGITMEELIKEKMKNNTGG